MTLEDAVKKLKSCIKCAKYVDSEYADCVELKALEKVVSSLEA